MTESKTQPVPFEVFLRDHSDAVMAYLRARVGAGAEDSFQETFIAALRAYPDFDGRNPRAWVITIARNKAIDALRAGAREKPVGGPEALDRADPAAEDFELGAQDLSRLVGELAEGQRDAVLLRFAADLSFRQIGDALGCSEAAARRRTHDGLARLRERYTKEDLQWMTD